MASSREYLDYILEQLTDAGEVSYRPMMGEYVLYSRGKVIGGIYDDRFLVKPTKSAAALLQDATLEEPYPGGREMLLVDCVENRALLCALLNALDADLPAPKKRGRQSGANHAARTGL